MMRGGPSVLNQAIAGFRVGNLPTERAKPEKAERLKGNQWAAGEAFQPFSVSLWGAFSACVGEGAGHTGPECLLIVDLSSGEVTFAIRGIKDSGETSVAHGGQACARGGQACAHGGRAC